MSEFLNVGDSTFYMCLNSLVYCYVYLFIATSQSCWILEGESWFEQFAEIMSPRKCGFAFHG